METVASGRGHRRVSEVGPLVTHGCRPTGHPPGTGNSEEGTDTPVRSTLPYFTCTNPCDRTLGPVDPQSPVPPSKGRVEVSGVDPLPLLVHRDLLCMFNVCTLTFRGFFFYEGFGLR